MLYNVLEELEHDHRSILLRKVGFINYGLSSIMIQLVRPTMYVSRVTRSKTLIISSSADCFGTTVLPAIVSAWVSREIVIDMTDLIFHNDTIIMKMLLIMKPLGWRSA